MDYFIALANTYNQTASPLIFNVGYYNEVNPTYHCITKLPKSHFSINPLTEGLYQIQNNILQANEPGSYTVQMFDLDNDNPPILFSLYVFRQLFHINSDILLRIFNKEIPAIYSPKNQLNKADNIATVGVLEYVYNYIYTLFFNSTTSLGVNSSYNLEWEKVYIGVNNLLQNAIYPAQFLKTLMQLKTKCSVQGFSIAITVSRLVFQFTGIATPVRVSFSDSGEYTVTIYYTGYSGWVLGEVGRSELGDTTILGSSVSNPFLWIINNIINRIMPAFVKFTIQYLPFENFEADYNLFEVGLQDYYDPNYLYDAYMVVNNNNIFTTKGYNLNP